MMANVLSPFMVHSVHSRNRDFRLFLLRWPWPMTDLTRIPQGWKKPTFLKKNF